MARIKCRYTFPYCAYNGRYDRERVYHDNLWWCDEDEVGCVGRYTKPSVVDPPNLANPQCKYCEYDHGEFEKTVKNYEYTGGTLMIGKTIYTKHEIDYLEIDGRVLVGDETAQQQE